MAAQQRRRRGGRGGIRRDPHHPHPPTGPRPVQPPTAVHARLPRRQRSCRRPAARPPPTRATSARVSTQPPRCSVLHTHRAPCRVPPTAPAPRAHASPRVGRRPAPRAAASHDRRPTFDRHASPTAPTPTPGANGASRDPCRSLLCTSPPPGWRHVMCVAC